MTDKPDWVGKPLTMRWVSSEAEASALCVHDWAREPQPVTITWAGNDTTDWWQGAQAFPCRNCGSLLVLNSREG